MSSEEHQSETKSSKAVVITRAWRLGGPLTPDQRNEAMMLFIEWLKEDPTVILACEHAGITSSTAYRWREKYKAFADDWEHAVARTQDIARSSIYRRGILGWDEQAISMGQPVFIHEPILNEQGEPQVNSQGKPLTRRIPLMVHKWSDSLAALYAKANLPEYKEKPQVNVNAHLQDLAEQTKQRLLADLEAAIVHEDKKLPQPEKAV